MKKALIITGVVGAVGTFFYLWQKRPKVVIDWNDKTGDGTVQIGNKRASVTKGQGVVVGTWNGYNVSLDAGTGRYLFRRYGKTIESSEGITPYDGGSSYVQINHR
jgi:hypothetical protein